MSADHISRIRTAARLCLTPDARSWLANHGYLDPASSIEKRNVVPVATLLALLGAGAAVAAAVADNAADTGTALPLASADHARELLSRITASLSEARSVLPTPPTDQ